jgi:hypothetical protein
VGEAFVAAERFRRRRYGVASPTLVEVMRQLPSGWRAHTIV